MFAQNFRVLSLTGIFIGSLVFCPNALAETSVEQCLVYHAQALTHRQDRLRRIETMRAWATREQNRRNRFTNAQANLTERLLAAMAEGFAGDTQVQIEKLRRALINTTEWELANPNRQGNGHNMRLRNSVAREAEALSPLLERDFGEAVSKMTEMPASSIARVEVASLPDPQIPKQVRFANGEVPAEHGFELIQAVDFFSADGTRSTESVRFHLYFQFSLDAETRYEGKDAHGEDIFRDIGPSPKYTVNIINLSVTSDPPAEILLEMRELLKDAERLPTTGGGRRSNYVQILRETVSPDLLRIGWIQGFLDSRWNLPMRPRYTNLDTSLHTLKRKLDLIRVIYQYLLFMPAEDCIQILEKSGKVASEHYLAYVPVEGEISLP